MLTLKTLSCLHKTLIPCKWLRISLWNIVECVFCVTTLQVKEKQHKKFVPASSILPLWVEGGWREKHVSSTTTCQNNVDLRSNLSDLHTADNKPGVKANYTVSKPYLSNVKLSLCQYEFAETTSTRNGKKKITCYSDSTISFQIIGKQAYPGFSELCHLHALI